ncbi:hypothetical protein ACFQ7J_11615 [Streptomyces sp. NPDC056501]|uniref:hypothetical protein n=1 Tax=Streptomyces sp. NPDC056501 TaxID=3345841 RepID=UPI0036B16D7F
MGETSACDRPAADLRTLREASGLTYSAITTQAKKQTPPVKLGGSKLSPWFTGKHVPKPAGRVAGGAERGAAQNALRLRRRSRSHVFSTAVALPANDQGFQ